MASPFPGMDPYLEDPATWSGVHAAFLGAVFETLGPALRPKYLVRFEERVYVTDEYDPAYRVIIPDVRIIGSGKPPAVPQPSGGLAIAAPIKVAVLQDAEIHDTSLKIIDVRDRSVVTVIELLSPTNKVPHSYGRELFLQKRREVIAGGGNWVEIDLLREGERTPCPPHVPQTEYQVYVSRAGRPREALVWPMPIRQPLPVIGIPLRSPDADVPLDLQAILGKVMERGSYDLDVEYGKEPVPPLKGEVAEWARALSRRC